MWANGRMPDVIAHNADEISACEKSKEAGEALERIIHSAEKISACEKAQEPERL